MSSGRHWNDDGRHSTTPVRFHFLNKIQKSQNHENQNHVKIENEIHFLIKTIKSQNHEILSNRRKFVEFLCLIDVNLKFQLKCVLNF